jgi:DNA repair exonuclease SbcCD ATPase subunit
MKTCFRSAVPAAALFLTAVFLAPALFGEDADVAQLREKAERGNVIAQYNLGLDYAEGKAVPKDLVEAYVWLRLAADNGGTGTALSALVRQMSVDELAAGRARLDERRSALPTVVSSPRKTSTAAPAGGRAASARTEDRFAALQEELAELRVDKARLSQQLASLQNGPNGSGAGSAQPDQHRTAELTAQLEAARKDLAAALKANEDLSTRGKKLLDEQDALKRQLAEDIAAAKRLTEVEGQLEEARKGLLAAKDSQAEMERSKKDLALARAHIDELTGTNQRLERQVRSDADDLRQRADAQAMIEDLKRANADLQTQIASLTGHPAQAAPAVPVAVAASVGGAADGELVRLKDELNRANAKVEMTVRSFALLREENERLKTKLAQTGDAGSGTTAVQPKAP